MTLSEGTSIISIFRWGNLGPGRLSHLPKDTQPGSGTAGYKFKDSGSTACTLLHYWNPKKKTEKSGGVLVATGWVAPPPFSLQLSRTQENTTGESMTRRHFPILGTDQRSDRTWVERGLGSWSQKSFVPIAATANQRVTGKVVGSGPIYQFGTDSYSYF